MTKKDIPDADLARFGPDLEAGALIAQGAGNLDRLGYLLLDAEPVRLALDLGLG